MRAHAQNTIDCLVDCVAALVARVSINQISFENEAGIQRVRKRRAWFGWILINIGNVVLLNRRAPLRVLHLHQWLRWEQVVSQAIRNEDVQVRSALVARRIPGQTLADLLSSSSSFESKLEALQAAAAALSELHQTEICLPANQSVLLSHGDASVANVIVRVEVDSEEKAKDGLKERGTTAEWFDFDLKHVLKTNANTRFADDLRALVFTAMPFFEPGDAFRLLPVVHGAYANGEVWRHFSEMINSPWLCWDVFHRAQVCRARPGSKVDPQLIREAYLTLPPN